MEVGKIMTNPRFTGSTKKLEPLQQYGNMQKPPLADFYIGRTTPEGDTYEEKIIQTLLSQDKRQHALVVGNPGAGKTSLVKKVMEILRARNVPVIEVYNRAAGDGEEAFLQAHRDKPRVVLVQDELLWLGPRAQILARLTELTRTYPNLVLLSVTDPPRIKMLMAEAPQDITLMEHLFEKPAGGPWPFMLQKPDLKTTLQMVANTLRCCGFDGFGPEIRDAIVAATPEAETHCARTYLTHILGAIREVLGDREDDTMETLPQAVFEKAFGAKALQRGPMW